LADATFLSHVSDFGCVRTHHRSIACQADLSATSTWICCHAPMRSAVMASILVLSCTLAHAGPKDRKTAKVLSVTGASVSGAVVLAGFLAAPDSKRINEPVMYTGLGMLFVTPSLGQFYAGEYVTLGMGVRALATGLAVYTLRSQTTLATCDTALSSTEPKCEIFTEGAYPLLGIAAIAFIGGVWYDALDAGDAADRYNQHHGFTVAPTLQQTAQGYVPGLSLATSW
jgi:hypothetical protein